MRAGATCHAADLILDADAFDFAVTAAAGRGGRGRVTLALAVARAAGAVVGDYHCRVSQGCVYIFLSSSYARRRRLFMARKITKIHFCVRRRFLAAPTIDVAEVCAFGEWLSRRIYRRSPLYCCCFHLMSVGRLAFMRAAKAASRFAYRCRRGVGAAAYVSRSIDAGFSIYASPRRRRGHGEPGVSASYCRAEKVRVGDARRGAPGAAIWPLPPRCRCHRHCRFNAP